MELFENINPVEPLQPGDAEHKLPEAPEDTLPDFAVDTQEANTCVAEPEQPACALNEEPEIPAFLNVRAEQPTQADLNAEQPQPECAFPAFTQAAQEYTEPMQQRTGNRRISPYEDSPYVINYAPVQKPKVKRRRKKGGFWKTAVCAVLILGLVAGSCYVTAWNINAYWEKKLNGTVERMENAFAEKLDELQLQINASTSGVSNSGTANTGVNGGMTPAQVYAKNVQSVVMIHNMLGNGTATGSGFILNEEGYIVTNYHVVEGGVKLSVTTYSGEEYKATLVGFDSTNDVALLKVEAEGLQAVTLGSSEELIVGDQVVAIGNPLGELTSTLTVGYISAKERDVNTDGFAINMLQTDAAINSGNSGGPLFNMKGEVVGITTAKYSGTSSSGATIEGVGFAIPIDDVSGLLSDLATYGYITGAYMGVSVSDMEPAAASYYGLPLGAYVQSVDEGYAAERAGVQPKDIIVAIDNTRVENVNDLTRALRGYAAGDKAVITLYRGGQEMKLEITLDEKPASKPAE